VCVRVRDSERNEFKDVERERGRLQKDEEETKNTEQKKQRNGVFVSVPISMSMSIMASSVVDDILHSYSVWMVRNEQFTWWWCHGETIHITNT